ncbi:MAG: hypothetical protein Q4P20_00105 [Eubacteriales bacterium]|nr:hypothetical protein [Eubacteriales bacterium]
MSIELVKKFAPYTDEVFKAESKTSLLTNSDFDWTGAHSVSVWKISTVPLQNYARNRSAADYSDPDSVASISRYGEIIDLDAQTEEMLLKNDRSFIFNVDRLDADETAGQLEAGKALTRELREVVVPEVDKYVYGVMVEKAGTVAEPANAVGWSAYTAIAKGNEALDDAEVPETDRVIVVTPATYRSLKECPDVYLDCDIAQEMRMKGVVAMIDGCAVVKVPAARLPKNFGFMIAHPSATVAPVKLEDYGTHTDTPLSSGTIVTGRICYDAFVLDNKKMGIYYQPLIESETGTTGE